MWWFEWTIPNFPPLILSGFSSSPQPRPRSRFLRQSEYFAFQSNKPSPGPEHRQAAARINTRAANDPSNLTFTEKAPTRVMVKTDGSFAAYKHSEYHLISAGAKNESCGPVRGRKSGRHCEHNRPILSRLETGCSVSIGAGTGKCGNQDGAWIWKGWHQNGVKIFTFSPVTR